MSQNSKRACITCSRRKVKCDKLLPGCQTCLKEGWECAGYPEAFRFRQSRWMRKRATTDVLGPAIEKWLVSEVDSLRLQLIDHLTKHPKSACAAFLPTRPFLHLIPARLGVSQVMDDAVRCICSVTEVTFDQPNAEILPTQQAQYSRALTSLLLALQPPSSPYAARQSPELLVAVVLLQMFEQSINMDAKKWIQHAGGALRLIEIMGPADFKDEFEAEVLLSQMGRLTFESLRTSRGSFLGTSPWQTVFHKCASILSRELDDKTLTIFENLEYHQITSLFPELFRQYKTLCCPITSSTVNLSHPVPAPIKKTEGSADHRNEQLDFDASSSFDAVMRFRTRLYDFHETLIIGRLAVCPDPSRIPWHEDRLFTAVDSACSAFMLFATLMAMQLHELVLATAAGEGQERSVDAGPQKRESLTIAEKLRAECFYFAKLLTDSFHRLRSISLFAGKCLGSSLEDVSQTIVRDREPSSEILHCTQVFAWMAGRPATETA